MAELSAYEAKRQQRMAENRAALLALQIDRLPAPKRPRREPPSKPLPPPTLRQSARIKALKTLTPAAIERMKRLDKRERLAESETPLPKVFKPRKELLWTPLDLPELDLNVYERLGPPVSTLTLGVDVDRFHDRWLGKQIVPVGKNPVMQGIVSASVSTKGVAPTAVFSRLSGLQQFRNAVALFVNVDQSTGYDNVFEEEQVDGGRVVFFRWYAQKTATLHFKPIQRLLQVRQGDARFVLDGSAKLESNEDTADGLKKEIETEEAKPEPLLLFLRQTLGPYVYCGRLGFLGVRPDARPLEFRWQLLDANAMDWTSIRLQLIDSLADAEGDKGEATASESAA